MELVKQECSRDDMCHLLKLATIKCVTDRLTHRQSNREVNPACQNAYEGNIKPYVSACLDYSADTLSHGWSPCQYLPDELREEDLMPGSLCNAIPGIVNIDTAAKIDTHKHNFILINLGWFE